MAQLGPVQDRSRKTGACRRCPGAPPIEYCIGFPFGGTPAGYPTGEVVAHTNVVQNDTRVHVTILNGLPDTQYVVSIACQRAIGSFNTND